MLHRLVAKLDLPSYLPKPDEILDGVQWLRENPGLAAGVMVGLTSYSVAKYYQLVDESDDDNDSDDDEVTREEIARSISAIQLGLLKVGLTGGSGSRRASTETVGTSRASSPSGSSTTGMRSRASSVFKPLLEEAEDDAVPHHHEPMETCGCSPSDRDVRQNAGDGGDSANAAPTRACCDPDWGWFVPHR